MSLPKGPKSQDTDSPVTPRSPKKGSMISTIQLSRPFLTKQQLKHAQSKTIDNYALYEQRRNHAFSFMMKVCISLKFPLRTLESSMIYYQRYFLHHKFDTGIYHDIATTCLFVASKNEDTIKKLRDIIAVAVQVRNVFFSPEQLESYRKRILGLEFKLLETISFDFRAYHVEEYLVKFSKTLRIPKDAAYLAWLLAYDSYQLDIALKAPPSAIAVALLEIAAKLEGANANIHYRELFVNMEAVNETKLDMLDFYINSYNFTIMATLRPDLKNSFMEMKIPMANAKVIIERDPKSIEEDAYFEERFHSSGERRYMLGNQKKRLYSEIQ